MSGERKINDWRAGYGAIEHSAETIERVEALLLRLVDLEWLRDREQGYALLAAADRVASQALWFVAHRVHARCARGDGRALAAADFLAHPLVPLGAALNMAVAYVGYLLANALSGETRTCVIERADCGVVVDAVNRLLQLPPEELDGRRHAFDVPALSADVCASSDALQYVHMPLPGQKLVAFLGEDAFAGQRGADWAPLWWRAEDCGFVAPVMIVGRRGAGRCAGIDANGEGAWFRQHLRLNQFEPIAIDGRDPAAFAWAILTQERYLEHSAQRVAEAIARYPVPLPFAVAEALAGFGFPDPAAPGPGGDERARARFNATASALRVEPAVFAAALRTLNNHADSGRSRERDCCASAGARIDAPTVPALAWCAADGEPRAPLVAIDRAFAAIAAANPHLRVRVGNPAALRDNDFAATLALLKQRVDAPRPGAHESLDGAVITAANAAAAAAAALGNKQGLNLIVGTAADAANMLAGVCREIGAARRGREHARAPDWLSVPLCASLRAWDSDADDAPAAGPVAAEALLGEMSDVARVLFPIDWNSAIAALLDVYATRGAIASVVAPSGALPALLDEAQARALVRSGIALIDGDALAPVQLLAVGALQLQQALLAARRLHSCAQAVSVWAVCEPGRFRQPRDRWEADYCGAAVAALPSASHRIFFCHTRPEVMLGTLRAWDLGAARTRALGYLNRGGGPDTFAALYANRCTWAHGIEALAAMRGEVLASYFDSGEIAALQGGADPLPLER